MTVSGPPSLTGRVQVGSLDSGIWIADYRSLTIYHGNLRLYRAVRAQMEGGAVDVVVPVFYNAQAPWPLGPNGDPVRFSPPVWFDDGAGFDDCSGMWQPVIAAYMAADADLRATSIVTTPAFVGLALLAPEFLMLFFGAHWLKATVVMQALCLVGIIQSLGLYNHGLILALGKPNWQTGLTLLYAVVNLATFVLVAHFGIGAVAIAFATRAYILYPLSIWLVMRLVPLSTSSYLKAVRAPVISAAVMAIAVALLRDLVHDWSIPIRILVLGGGGAAIYFLCMLIIGRADLNELRSLALSLKAGRQ